jgi:hypothetical protein
MPSRHPSRSLRAFFVGATIGLALVLFVGAAIAEPSGSSVPSTVLVPRGGAATLGRFLQMV